MKKVVTLLLFISFNIHAQQIQQELNYNAASLDSLLFNGDIKTFIETWGSLVKNSQDMNVSAKDSTKYQALYENILKILNSDNKRLQELSLNFQKSVVNDKYIYPKINVLYQKFLNAIADEQWRQALNFYYIGRYFRNKQIELEKTRLRQNYQDAENLYLKGLFDETFNSINVFREEDPANPAFFVLKDSLEFLYNNLEKKTKSKIFINEVESSIIPINKHLTISFNFNYLFSQTAGDKDIVLRHKTYRDWDIPVGYLVDEDNYGFKVAIDYYINSKISVGARAGIDVVTNSEITTFSDTVYLREKAFTFGITGTYFIKDKSWFRPYLRIETGIINVIRNKIELDPSGFWSSQYYPINELNVIYPQVLLEIGAEAELWENSPIYLGLNFFLFNHWGKSQIINHYILGGGIVLGVNLL
jgi:hypothetical protein